RCSRAQFLACPHRPDERSNLHATQAFLRPLERLAIFDADPVPRLVFSPAAARPGAAKQLALHPGSGSDTKNWPEANWADLVQQPSAGSTLKLLLVGGEAEGERLQRLSAALPHGRVRVAQSLPLPDLARLLVESVGFIGHDSGISHLAAAVGLPGLI